MMKPDIDLTSPTVQLSLDVPTLDDALAMAEIAIESGIDWLEVGTPLILGEGLQAVRALHERYPQIPIVADVKIMDGGYLETEMMAKAGASFVVVMAASHPATVRAAVAAGRNYGIYIMGDILGVADRVAAARSLQNQGVDIVVAHLGYDERKETGGSPLDFLGQIVQAVTLPIQAVGGLQLHELPRLPALGAPLVVVGAPLVIDNRVFSPVSDRIIARKILEEIVNAVKTQGVSHET